MEGNFALIPGWKGLYIGHCWVYMRHFSHYAVFTYLLYVITFNKKGPCRAAPLFPHPRVTTCLFLPCHYNDQITNQTLPFDYAASLASLSAKNFQCVYNILNKQLRVPSSLICCLLMKCQKGHLWSLESFTYCISQQQNLPVLIPPLGKSNPFIFQKLLTEIT